MTHWEFSQSAWLTEPPFGYTRVPGWLPATVPGHVHLDLVANGIIRHPFEQMAELGCQWVDECDWSYRTRFQWEPGDGEILRFEGLDTICTVSLNGTELARHDNMFLPLVIDLQGKLLPGENELRVDFESAIRVGRERRTEYFAKEGIDEDVSNFEERAFVRKAQFMFGWDWGPRLVSCGIWKPVTLGHGQEPAHSPSRNRSFLRRESDDFGESFEFVVDGMPVWARGANWIPVHSFPSSSIGLKQLLESCKAMNFNMLRVWGGGLYESEEFYDLCDELGILVWQDFPFACSYYPDDDSFVNEIRKEATYHVKRLRSHPCLALWCGNNENLTMWEGKWGAKNPGRFYGERIWDQVLRDVVAEHDPGRPYIPTSPIGSPPGKQDCNAGGYGDSHYWDVWHGRGDWVHYADSTARFSSEFGFPSCCGIRAVGPSPSTAALSTGTSKEGWTQDEFAFLKWHDKTGRPFEYLRDLIGKHYPEPKNLDEWIYYSQLNQRDAMRYAVEHYRRSIFCKGTLIWQCNDVWPTQSWSLIDCAGDLKAAAYEMKRLYADQLLSFERTDESLTLWWINDGGSSCDSRASQLTAFDSLSGAELQSWPVAHDLSLAPEERREVLHVSLGGFDLTRTVFLARVGDARRSGFLCEPKDLKVDPVPIRATCTFEGILEIDAERPVIDLQLSESNGSASFATNWLSLAGGEKLAVHYKGKIDALIARSLAGFHEVILASHGR